MPNYCSAHCREIFGSYLQLLSVCVIYLRYIVSMETNQFQNQYEKRSIVFIDASNITVSYAQLENGYGITFGEY